MEVANPSSSYAVRLKVAAKIALLILKKLRFRKTHLSLVFVSDSEMKRINQAYLKHPWVTDVLAFPFGEIIIAPKQAYLYAKKHKLSFREELVRYICHGILHLRGYRDNTKKAQKLMRKKEDSLIRVIGREIQRII